jgi:hypothetical protein
MDQINSTLNALLANFQNQQVAFVILVAVTIFVLSLGLSFVFMGATNPIRRRLDHFFHEEEDNEGSCRMQVIAGRMRYRLFTVSRPC